MKFCIILTSAAKSDLREIFRYVELNDSAERADSLVNDIEQLIGSLAALPERGHLPLELECYGNRELRELHFKPFRIIYSISDKNVTIHCVLDGRRDMRSLLQQRLLR